MRAILLALIWCVGLAGKVTTRSSGDDNRAGQMLQAELEAGDLAARRRSMRPRSSWCHTRTYTRKAASCAARWPTQPGPQDLLGGAARAARLRSRRKYTMLCW
jgi:hypothetical protein